MGRQPPVGQALFIGEVVQLHLDTPQWIGLLWTSDQPDVETSPQNTQHLLHAPAGTEPTIPASGWPKNHALDSGATDISFLLHKLHEQHSKASVGANMSRVRYQICLKLFQNIVNDLTLISVSHQIINFVFVELLYQDFVPYLVYV
jgi:hypothetical protein